MGSAGTEEAALFVAIADGGESVIRLSTAGEAQIWKITAAGVSSLAGAVPPLGRRVPIERREQSNYEAQPGDILVAVSEGAASALAGGQGRAADELLSALLAHREQPAKVLVELIHDRLTALVGESALTDCAAVLVKSPFVKLLLLRGRPTAFAAVAAGAAAGTAETALLRKVELLPLQLLKLGLLVGREHGQHFRLGLLLCSRISVNAFCRSSSDKSWKLR